MKIFATELHDFGEDGWFKKFSLKPFEEDCDYIEIDDDDIFYSCLKEGKWSHYNYSRLAKLSDGKFYYTVYVKGELISKKLVNL